MNQNNHILWQAVQQVLSGETGGSRDPIKNLYQENGAFQFDHDSIFGFLNDDRFNQGNINRDNIKSAATLYAIMILGDEMGIFRVTDVVLKYVTLGRIDVASSTTATGLYEYMKLKDTRITAHERCTFYQQVFNLGSCEPIGGMANNRNFGGLWETLMHEVIRFIRKYERADNPENVSRASIHQVILDLQNNLSTSTSGFVKPFIYEMYTHLENAIALLDAPEIKDQIGHGVARDIWNVIESISREEFGHYPNTSALRSVAANARRIILDISDYSFASFDEDSFHNFIRNVEAFIVAKSQLENGGNQMEPLPGEGNYEEAVMEEDPVYENMDEDWDF